MPRERPTLGMVIVAMLILVAAGLTISLFIIPTDSSWFWPTVGALAVVSAAALLIPLQPKH